MRASVGEIVSAVYCMSTTWPLRDDRDFGTLQVRNCTQFSINYYKTQHYPYQSQVIASKQQGAYEGQASSGVDIHFALDSNLAHLDGEGYNPSIGKPEVRVRYRNGDRYIDLVTAQMAETDETVVGVPNSNFAGGNATDLILYRASDTSHKRFVLTLKQLNWSEADACVQAFSKASA